MKFQVSQKCLKLFKPEIRTKTGLKGALETRLKPDTEKKK